MVTCITNAPTLISRLLITINSHLILMGIMVISIEVMAILINVAVI